MNEHEVIGTWEMRSLESCKLSRTVVFCGVGRLDTTGGYGISVDGGGSNELLGNDFSGTGFVNLQYGIKVGSSDQGEYSCNIMDNIRTGLWFQSSNLSSDIAGNNFSNFFHGLRVGSEGVGGLTGVQSHRGNMWLTAPVATGYGAIHYTTESFELTNSRLFVDTIDGGNLISTERTYINGQRYFRQEAGNTAACSSAAIGGDGGGSLSSTEYGIATGAFNIGVFAAEGWTARRQLYRRLLADPTLAPQGSVYASFLGTEKNSTVGRFEAIKASIESVLTGDAGTRASLASQQTSMSTKMGEMRSIMDALSVQPNNAGLIAQRDAKKAEMETLAIQSQALEQTMLSARTVAAAQLLGTNAAVSTTTNFEANQRTANRVYLELIANNQTELTATQISDLTPIANQCPYSGGEGVYMARALLGNEAIYNDLALCGLAAPQPIARPNDEDKVVEPSFRMYPNPANQYLVVELVDKSKGEGLLTLTNAFGVQVLAETIMEGTEAIPVDTGKIPAGTYFLTLKSSTGNQTQVLVISK